MEISFKQTLFSIDPKNRRCNDCGEKDVKFVSINNGITICALCAQIHIQLGSKISKIHKIDEDFDDYSMNFFIYGGNKNFKKAMKSLGVNLDMQRTKLYKSSGVAHYRKCLKAKVEGGECNDHPPDNPNEILNFDNDKIDNDKKYKNGEDKNIKNFLSMNNKNNVDFEDNNGESHVQLYYQENQNLGKKNDIISFKDNLLKKSVDTMKSLGGYIKKKSAKSLSAIKKAGKLIVDKSRPAAQKIKSTAIYVGEHIPYLNKFKNKSHEIKDGNVNTVNEANNDKNTKKDNMDKVDNGKEDGGNQIEF